MTDGTMNLHAPVEKAPDSDILRETISFAAERPTALEVGAEEPWLRGDRRKSDRDARASRRRAATVAGLALAALSLNGAVAEDVAPKVSPDRIDDVPSTKPDPFPAFDNFAWRAFVALNWPALAEPERRGEPDRAKSLADPGPRVWETFKARWEVFQPGPDGRAGEPAAWGSYAGPNPCGAGFDNRAKTLASFVPYADFNQASFAPGRFVGPLVARNRTYTRYEVRINRAEFDSIVDHRWFERANGPTPQAPAHFNVDSIAVKAAWRVLTDADPPAVRSRYYVVANAQVVDVARSLAAGAPICAAHDVALVGMHIAVKTKYRPQWLWSSFEHVDNVPPVGAGEAREPDAKAAGVRYAYNDPDKGQGEVAASADAPATQPVGVGNPPRPDPEPTQVIREHPINAETMAMNRAYWALPQIRGTVWANYMLVATQWPTVTQPPTPANDGRYFPGLRVEANTPAEPYQVAAENAAPENLVNVTMETYAQDQPSSCMACHHAVSNSLGRDFVAILIDAR